MHGQRRTIYIGFVAVGLTLGIVVGCSRTETAPEGSLPGAPHKWSKFLPWAQKELAKTPPPVPLPNNPHLPKRKWPTLRLDEMLGRASIQCDWQAPSFDRDALVSLGPFDSDRPAKGFDVRGADDDLGPAAMLVFSGFVVRREEVGAISIDIRQPFGKHFDLIWSRAGKIRVPIPDNNRFWTLNITTDGFAEWNGRLDRIAIRTDGTGSESVEVRAIKFLRRENAFEKPVGLRRVDLNREIRDAIYTHCPSEVKLHNVSLPANAKLQTGLGLVVDRAVGPSRSAGSGGRASGARFEVLVESDDKQVSVLKRDIDRNDRWLDVSVSLEAWGGRTVSLILRTTSDTPTSVACWANPVVYQPVDQPPCVIVYLIDALAAGHIDLYGYDRPTMPRLKALAGRGVWFANMFANSPQTVESVPSLMLSLPTDRHGTYHASIAAPLELVSMADALQAAGFATASFCTNVNAGPRQNMDQGFDHFFDRIAYHWSGQADRTVPIEEVMTWIKVHRDRPTFLYIHTAEPHAPYTPPSPFAGRFDRHYQGSIDGTYHREHGFLQSKSERDIAHVAALYDEEVAYADARLGAFLDALRAAGSLDRTHIFVIADHGEEFREHGNWGHGRDLHNEVMRIPLVAAGPMVTGRGRQDVPAQLLDLMPTILDMYDLPPPYRLAGQSLLPLLQDRGASAGAEPFDELRSRTIFATSYAGHTVGIIQYAAIEAGRWKLMYRFNEEATMFRGLPADFALFDLHADPDEKRNVIDAHRDVARRLIGKLINWRRQQAPFDTGPGATRLMLSSEQLEELRSLGYIDSD